MSGVFSPIDDDFLLFNQSCVSLDRLLVLDCRRGEDNTTCVSHLVEPGLETPPRV